MRSPAVDTDSSPIVLPLGQFLQLLCLSAYEYQSKINDDILIELISAQHLLQDGDIFEASATLQIRWSWRVKKKSKRKFRGDYKKRNGLEQSGRRWRLIWVLSKLHKLLSVALRRFKDAKHHFPGKIMPSKDRITAVHRRIFFSFFINTRLELHKFVYDRFFLFPL